MRRDISLVNQPTTQQYHKKSVLSLWAYDRSVKLSSSIAFVLTDDLFVFYF